MSGDGPLSVIRYDDAPSDPVPHALYWRYGQDGARFLMGLTVDAADVIAGQLDRARRCAEAEANLLLCSLALSSMEDERDDARAERDAALAEVERLEEALRSLTAYSAEVGALRAELAARPVITCDDCGNPLTRLGALSFSAPDDSGLVRKRHHCGCVAEADPAPAPDTVTITVSREDAPLQEDT